MYFAEGSPEACYGLQVNCKWLEKKNSVITGNSVPNFWVLYNDDLKGYQNINIPQIKIVSGEV